MAYTNLDIRDLLKPTTLTELYVRSQAKSELLNYFDGAETANFTDLYVKVPVRPVIATQASINPVNREAAPLHMSGLEMRTFQSINLMNTFTISHDEFRNDVYNTAAIVKEQLQSVGDHFTKSKEAALAKMFLEGKVYITNDSKICESTGDSAYVATIDFGIPSSNLGTCGGLVGSWNNPSTDIFLQLDALKIQSEKNGSPAPKHVWMNSNMKQYLRSNTQIANFVKGSYNLSDAAWTGAFINLNNFTFHFVDTTYPRWDSTNSSPVQAMVIPDGKAIITPDLGDSRWFKKYLGAKSVPNDIVVGGMDNLDNNISVVFGDYAYSKTVTNPVGWEVVIGSHFLYALRDRYAVYGATIV